MHPSYSLMSDSAAEGMAEVISDPDHRDDPTRSKFPNFQDDLANKEFGNVQKLLLWKESDKTFRLFKHGHSDIIFNSSGEILVRHDFHSALSLPRIKQVDVSDLEKRTKELRKLLESV